jgi:Fic-DOC domain mobile mystery protein B
MDAYGEGDGGTSLSPEEKLDLILGIFTRAQLNEAERLNIADARSWAMGRAVLARDDLLTDGFGRKLHLRMFDQVWLWAGSQRKTEKTLGWDVQRIAEGVRNAFEDALAQEKNESYSLGEIAVRLHHRLVEIHPWPNGNGRWSRLVADVLVASRRGAKLTWGAGGDIATAGDVRARYLAAVRAANGKDFGPLLDFARS